MSDTEPIEPIEPIDAELGAQLTRRVRQRLDDHTRDTIVTSVARSTASGQPLARWRWNRLAAVAAALSIVLIAVAGVASLQPIQPPSAGAAILDAAGVTAAVATVGQTGTSQTVLARVTIDTRPVLSMLGLPFCVTPPCEQADGSIVGTGSPGILTWSSPEANFDAFVGPDGTVSGVVALLIDPNRTHLLGVVQADASGSVVRTATEAALHDAESGLPGSAVIVTGFLHPMGVMHCPFIPATGDPLATTPFAICDGSWIADHIAPEGQAPDGLITVQPDVSAFILQPVNGNAADTPQATYVLRLDANPNSGCAVCRGWEVVGRLGSTFASESPAPSPSPSAAADPVVRTAGEMSDLLRQNGSAWIGHVMVIQGSLVPMGGPPCTSADCPIGAFDGADELIYAPDATLRGSVAGGRDGTFAVKVLDQGLELVGAVVLNDAGGPLWPAKAAALGPAAGDVLVNGWLTATAYPCPPAPITDQDTPFYYCADSWITTDAVPQSDYERGDPGFLDVDGVPVQPSAFVTFAAGATDGAGLSVHGIYVLQPVTAPNGTQCSPCSAWRVVARVDADPATPSTSAAPLPSVATVLSLDELRAAIAGHQGARLQPLDVVANVSIYRGKGARGIDCPDRFEACDEIGTIDGAADLGNVLQREDPDVQISGNATAPIALRINDHGQLIFLGHVDVDPTGPGVAWTVQQAAAAADQLPENELVAVDGWLAGNLSTCGPVVFPPPSPPAWDPFQCYGSHYLEAQPEQLYGMGGSSSSEPTGAALKLGVNEYAMYAPDPASNLAPRHGVYLVKSVVNHSNLESQACTGCRGWLIVGRLEPPAAP